MASLLKVTWRIKVATQILPHYRQETGEEEMRKKMKHFQVEEFPFKHPSQCSRQYLYIHLITEFIQETLYFIHFVTPGHSYIPNKIGSTF